MKIIVTNVKPRTKKSFESSSADSESVPHVAIPATAHSPIKAKMTIKTIKNSLIIKFTFQSLIHLELFQWVIVSRPYLATLLVLRYRYIVYNQFSMLY